MFQLRSRRSQSYKRELRAFSIPAKHGRSCSACKHCSGPHARACSIGCVWTEAETKYSMPPLPPCIVGTAVILHARHPRWRFARAEHETARAVSCTGTIPLASFGGVTHRGTLTPVRRESKCHLDRMSFTAPRISSLSWFSTWRVHAPRGVSNTRIGRAVTLFCLNAI